MRVVHYVNQFFGGLGGEEAADRPLERRAGAVGPAIGLQQALGERGQVVATLIGGDTYVAEHEADVAAAIASFVRELQADVLVAGPAFNAGRYGLACALACRSAGIPAVAAMHSDNPAVEASRRHVYILPTGATASDMRRALGALAEFAVKLGSGQPIGRADAEGYLPRGFRKNEHVERPAAQRMLDLLHAKLAGRPYASEIPNQSFEVVAPAPPLTDPASALLAVVTEAGVVPRGNPDRIKFSAATNWAVYSLDVVQPGQVEVVHGGYDASFANEDPNRVLPVDALRDLVASGEVGGLLERYFVTVGNGTPVETCTAFGVAMAAELQLAGVTGVVLPATLATGTRCGATLAKEIERAGIPVALVTAMTPVAQRVGASRIVTGGRIPHPASDPTRPPDAERAFRRTLVRMAIKALTTPVTEPTVFAAQ